MELTVKGCSRVSVTVTGAAIQAASQYGLNNPSLIAWELVPYSFVVDWFLPVGDYLERLGAFSGLKFSDYSYTESADWSRTFTSTDKRVWGPPGVFYTPSRVSNQHDRVYTKERTLTGFAPYDFPVFSNGLNLRRFTSAAALLQQAFSKNSWHK